MLFLTRYIFEFVFKKRTSQIFLQICYKPERNFALFDTIESSLDLTGHGQRKTKRVKQYLCIHLSLASLEYCFTGIET